MADKKILLVEDVSIEAMDIKRTLESFGYEVPYVVSSVEKAVEKAIEILPDLILMDIVLKGDSGGIDAVSKIKDLNIPVIYLTAHSEEPNIERAKLTEPYGYIIKPYDRTELKYAIDLAIYKSEQEKKLLISEALHKIQDKLKIAMDLAKLVNWEYDVDSDMFTFDDRFYALYGTSVDEEGGNEMSSEVYASKFIPPEDSAIVASEIAKALETDDPNYFGTIDHKIIRADGEERYITVRFGVIKDSDGRTIKTYGANQDITERKKAEKSLVKAYHRLKLRTSELTNTNFLLKAEIKQRRIMEEIIQDNLKRLKIALESAQMGAWDLDLVNDTAIRTLEHDQIFGYDSLLPEWGSKIFFEHIVPEDREYAQQRFDKAYETNKLYFQCRINRADNKKVRWIEVFGNVYRDEKDVPIRILGVVVDITERKESEDQLLKVIEEKEMLLTEIHHRVKNNMQIISSLLNLQSQYVEEEETLSVLKESQGRVKSMALIEEKLYQSPDMSHINFKQYVEKLVSDILQSYRANTGLIHPIIQIDNIEMNMETAIPCGLIINELVTNSIKYSFPGDREGEVRVSLKNMGEQFVLIISDNGIGLPEDLDFQSTESLGLQLVNSLTDQLDGEIEVDKSHGTEFKITFKELEYRERF
jgi:PAS domain S-box-containing protein